MVVKWVHSRPWRRGGGNNLASDPLSRPEPPARTRTATGAAHHGGHLGPPARVRVDSPVRNMRLGLRPPLALGSPQGPSEQRVVWSQATKRRGERGMMTMADQWLLRPREAADLLGVSRAMVYLAVQRGELPVVRIGHCVRTPAEAVKRWIDDTAGDWASRGALR